MIAALSLLALLTDAEKADARPTSDYPLMGEYVQATGPLRANAEPQGLQVRPVPDVDGETAYQLVFYPGGLPGAGATAISTAESPNDGHPPADVVKGDGVLRLTVSADDAREWIEGYYRVNRVSPTIGAPPTEGAVVLFDADKPSLDHWVEGAELLDGYLKAGAETKQTFGDAIIHLEFRIPLQTDKLDTWRGNSGAYVQNRYEIQVLESFGDIVRSNGSGSIYRLHTPPANAALPPGHWQTLDVVFKAAKFDGDGDDATKTANARMTVAMNGVLLFDDVEVPKLTNGHKLDESPAGGPLHLQDHGDPVVYRNVWILPTPSESD